MSNDEQDEEMICALTADEYVALKNGLRELPQTMPPSEVWQRIREQAQAEGLFATLTSHRRWYAGIGLAATVAMIAVVMTMDPGVDRNSVTVPEYREQANTELSGLRALMVESSQLERDLHALPAEPRVAQAGTVATLGELQDRIAAIDYQLSDPAVTMSREDREIFWRERVRLMKLLLQLRYAQAQRTAY